jgi:hypothetical protein
MITEAVLKNWREHQENEKKKKKERNRIYYQKMKLAKMNNINLPKFTPIIQQEFSVLNNNCNNENEEIVEIDPKLKKMKYDNQLVNLSHQTEYYEKKMEDKFVFNQESFFNNDKILSKDDGILNNDITLREFKLTFESLRQQHHIAENSARDILKLINEVFLDKDKQIKIKEKCDLLKTKLYSMCIECHQVEFLDLESYKFNSYNVCQNCNKETINFVTFDVEIQIRLILKNENLFNQIMMSNQSSRNKNNSSLIDATDGQIYQSFIKNIDSKYLVISFNVNTDGAPVDNSGKYNIWPAFGNIVELKSFSRESFKNMIYFGN